MTHDELTAQQLAAQQKRIVELEGALREIAQAIAPILERTMGGPDDNVLQQPQPTGREQKRDEVLQNVMARREATEKRMWDIIQANQSRPARAPR